MDSIQTTSPLLQDYYAAKVSLQLVQTSEEGIYPHLAGVAEVVCKNNFDRLALHAVRAAEQKDLSRIKTVIIKNVLSQVKTLSVFSCIVGLGIVVIGRVPLSQIFDSQISAKTALICLGAGVAYNTWKYSYHKRRFELQWAQKTPLIESANRAWIQAFCEASTEFFNLDRNAVEHAEPNWRTHSFGITQSYQGQLKVSLKELLDLFHRSTPSFKQATLNEMKAVNLKLVAILKEKGSLGEKIQVDLKTVALKIIQRLWAHQGELAALFEELTAADTDGGHHIVEY